MTSFYLHSITQSHEIIATAQVYSAGAPTGIFLPIDNGTITVDRTQARRRSFSLTFTDNKQQFVPQGPTSLLAPYGNEIAIRAGVDYKFGDVLFGTTETFPLGIFPIAGCDTRRDAKTGDIVVTLTGYDRSWTIARAGWPDAMQIDAGTKYVDAIKQIIMARAQFVLFTFNFASSPLILPNDAIYGMTSSQQDPWKDASDLAAAAGMELYFDVNGNCVLSPIPDPTTLPVSWTFADGSNLEVCERSMTVDTTYNHIVVIGSGASVAFPSRGEAKDTNPASPTYIGGPYGDVAHVIEDQSISTQADANAFAASELQLDIGMTDVLTLEVLPDHRVTEGTVAQVTNAATRTDGKYIIQAMSIPLGTGPLKVTAQASVSGP